MTNGICEPIEFKNNSNVCQMLAAAGGQINNENYGKECLQLNQCYENCFNVYHSLLGNVTQTSKCKQIHEEYDECRRYGCDEQFFYTTKMNSIFNHTNQSNDDDDRPTTIAARNIFEQALILFGIFIIIFVLLISSIHYWQKYQQIKRKYRKPTLYKMGFS
ncbi:hypothetical protein HUG17_10666 [Dermatophagoides farinae]|uniref:Transmembrane protein n=1 Tax=Dermatophagoides farinae TaxID=6954 RepID=A0A9D4NXK9_DERFA|nr:hypothetical protein HUG17_10666 [Dermatophagoides farinae]